MRSMMRAGGQTICVVAAALAWLLALPASAQLPPDARWRTFETEHFRVNYVEGLDSIARRAADRAEEAFALLARELPHAPRSRVELMVANNVDLANGYATPFPTNRIVLYAHPPVGTPELAFYEDWVRLVVLHELVHIFHLDTSGGIWRRLRRVFGRNVGLFPHVFSPGWVTEGLAVYYESLLTPAGRLRGTQHEMALRSAVLEDEFFPIDRASHDPVSWPAGNARYIYGSRFLDFVARRYGPEALSRWVAQAGRQIVPFRPDAAARRAFGSSFTREWRAWEDSLRSRYAAQADSLRAAGLTTPEVLTEHGRVAAFPRFAPRGSALVYAASTGRETPALRLVEPGGETRDVARLNTPAPASWSPDGRELLVPQLNFVDPYRIYSDLYRVRLDGSDRRLSRAARIWETDLHRDGRTVVGVADAQGTNVLALHDLETGVQRAITPPRLDVQWSLPRWSPLGDRMAVARWSAGGLYDVVLVDSTGSVQRELTRDRALDTGPAWSPDGRYVVFSSDRTGIQNLFAYDLRENRLWQVTSVLTGAVQPDVSPDGRWIAFSYYRADGWHIARIPFDPASWRPAPATPPALASALDTVPLAGAATQPSRPYSPFPSVLPAAWSLLVPDEGDLGYGIGAGAAGVDAIDRHVWAVEGSVLLEEARLQGSASYSYLGLGLPVLAAAARQDWSVLLAEQQGTDGGAKLSAAFRRTRDLSAAAVWVRRRWRSSSSLATGLRFRDLYDQWEDPARAGNRRLIDRPLDAALTLSARHSSARAYAYSLGPQEGFRLTSSAEAHRYLRPLPGESERRGYLRSTSHAQAYLPLFRAGFARHVLATRADLGVETGSVSPGFVIGGASGGRAPLPIELDFLGGGVAFPLRGYRQGAQVGNRALTASAEYRFPLLLVERGFRTWPVFLERLWGDVFADAGTAWCAAGCQTRFRGASPDPRLLASVGAELFVDLQIGYGASLPLRFGAAFPLREPYSRSPEFYIRVGRGF